VASGALQVYVYTRILALFAPVPYATPEVGEDELEVSLKPHLTNTCLQAELGGEHVRLFDELIGRRILSGSFGKFTEGDLNSIVNQVSDVLADTFRAAVDSPVHFQARLDLRSLVPGLIFCMCSLYLTLSSFTELTFSSQTRAPPTCLNASRSISWKSMPSPPSK
jgi:hypothetical protein